MVKTTKKGQSINTFKFMVAVSKYTTTIIANPTYFKRNIRAFLLFTNLKIQFKIFHKIFQSDTFYKF
jgi:hypothetical protein